MAKEKFAGPAIPFGIAIGDPSFLQITPTEPPLIRLDLEVVRKLFIDPEIVAEIFWGKEEIELPPIPVDLIVKWIHAEKLEYYPGQLRQLYKIKSRTPTGKTILFRPEYKHNTGCGPGWFYTRPYFADTDVESEII